MEVPFTELKSFKQDVIKMDATLAETEMTNTSIVLAGAFTPALHHPQWYQSLGVLSGAELEEALSQIALSPFSTTFSWGTFTISCTPQQWAIITSSPDENERVIQITKRFLETGALSILAVGYNYISHVKTGKENILSAMDAGLALNRFGPDDASLQRCSLTLGRKSGIGFMTIKLEPSVTASSRIFVSVNIELKKEEIGARVADLGLFVEEQFATFEAAARREIGKIALLVEGW
jgi:hypothetical protein